MLSRAALLVLAAVLLLPASALAAPPSNDDWANRTPLALPSESTVGDISTATTEASDPVFACGRGRDQGHLSVWYSFTTGPDTHYVNLSTAGSTFGGALLAVYAGAPGSFRPVTGGCVDDDAGVAEIAGLRLRPNTTYSIELAAEDGPVPGNEASLSLTEAPVYRVTTTLDGGGACTGAACTLRAAIDAANAAPGAVVVPAGQYTLTGPADEDADAGGDLDVQPRLAVYGAGAGDTVIDAGHADRVVDVLGGRGTLALTDLTLRNGTTSGDGGGLRDESGASFVDLDGVSIEASHAAASGGGIAITGPGRLVRGMLTGNSADGGGALFLGRAGALFEVSDSTLAGNAATFGGGIAAAGDVAVVDSTLSNDDGGALLTGGTATLRSVTVAGNTAAPHVIDGAGGITLNPGAVVDVRNSVIADSHGGPDCAQFGATFTAAYTLAEDPGGCAFSGAGDVIGSDPGLLPLADNGGATLTQRVPIGSPLLDSGDPAGCRDADGALLTTDQRGLPRAVNGDAVAGARCDEGAVEKPDEAPVCRPAAVETAEDTPAAIAPPCHDPEGLPLTYDGWSAAHGAFDGSLYRPALNYDGPDALGFVAHDEANAVSGSVDVRVTAVDDAPVAHDDAGGVSLAAPGVLANDTDVEGDELTARVATPPAHGTVLLAADGAYRYVPAHGFSGTDSFTYRAHDPGAVSAPATVTITVPRRKPRVSRLAAVRHGRALRFTLSVAARTTVRLTRGKKLIKTYVVRGRRGANTLRIAVKRGRYRVRLTARAGGRSTTVRRTLRLGAA
jgi:CSLREA domain-containing protein